MKATVFTVAALHVIDDALDEKRRRLRRLHHPRPALPGRHGAIGETATIGTFISIAAVAIASVSRRA